MPRLQLRDGQRNGQPLQILGEVLQERIAFLVTPEGGSFRNGDPARQQGLEAFPPRYNIAPTQPILMAVNGPANKRQGILVRWGLVPTWVKDPADFTLLINARSETVASKPAFRNSLRRKRCIILADGFYEWKKVDGGKQPYHIHLKDRRPFAFAGLWERWHDKAEDRKLDSFTIVTTEANKALSPIHHRMPVILAPADHATTRIVGGTSSRTPKRSCSRLRP